MPGIKHYRLAAYPDVEEILKLVSKDCKVHECYHIRALMKQVMQTLLVLTGQLEKLMNLQKYAS